MVTEPHAGRVGVANPVARLDELADRLTEVHWRRWWETHGPRVDERARTAMRAAVGEVFAGLVVLDAAGVDDLRAVLTDYDDEAAGRLRALLPAVPPPCPNRLPVWLGQTNYSRVPCAAGVAGHDGDCAPSAEALRGLWVAS